MKNEDILDRLDHFCELIDLPKEDFAVMIDVKTPFVTSEGVDAGQCAAVLAAFPQLNLNWLLYETGDMLQGGMMTTIQ
ncbi:MAG TPA: hypothetical protein DCE41_15855 [Cytophagales bacterium]|nr:hypothetical protein [Cytophagales bacterium]HAA23364.1 hypothetical protein [Cytophagales bacterium]HAP63677.1 hypothetical protein [Cytophagales bacterium]